MTEGVPRPGQVRGEQRAQVINRADVDAAGRRAEASAAFPQGHVMNNLRPGEQVRITIKVNGGSESREVIVSKKLDGSVSAYRTTSNRGSENLSLEQLAIQGNQVYVRELNGWREVVGVTFDAPHEAETALPAEVVSYGPLEIPTHPLQVQWQQYLDQNPGKATGIRGGASFINRMGPNAGVVMSELICPGAQNTRVRLLCVHDTRSRVNGGVPLRTRPIGYIQGYDQGVLTFVKFGEQVTTTVQVDVETD